MRDKPGNRDGRYFFLTFELLFLMNMLPQSPAIFRKNSFPIHNQ